MSGTKLAKRGDIQVRQTDRRVRVFDATGNLLADSSSPVELDEYRYPTRYYLPQSDVKWNALESIEQTSYCPYKGTADRHWRAKSSPDAGGIAWSYSAPLPADPAVRIIKDRVAFYTEKLSIEVDGERSEE